MLEVEAGLIFTNMYSEQNSQSNDLLESLSMLVFCILRRKVCKNDQIQSL